MPLDKDVTFVDLNNKLFRRSGNYSSVTKQQVNDMFYYANSVMMTETAEGKGKMVLPDDDERKRNYSFSPGEKVLVAGTTSNKSRQNKLFTASNLRDVQGKFEEFLTEGVLQEMKSYLQLTMSVSSLRQFAHDPAIQDKEIQYLKGFRHYSPFTIKAVVYELATDFDGCLCAIRRNHRSTIQLSGFMVKFFTEWNCYANSVPKMSLDCGQLIEMLQKSKNETQSLESTFDAAIVKSNDVTASLYGVKKNYSDMIKMNEKNIAIDENDMSELNKKIDDLKDSADKKTKEFNTAKLAKEDLEKELNRIITKLWVACHDYVQTFRMKFNPRLRLRFLQTENNNRRKTAKDNVENKKKEVEEATKMANSTNEMIKYKLEEIEEEMNDLILTNVGYKEVEERVQQLHNLFNFLNDQCANYKNFINSFMDVFTSLKGTLDSFIGYNDASIKISMISPRVLEAVSLGLTLKAIAELHKKLIDKFVPSSAREFSNLSDLEKEIKEKSAEVENFINLGLSAAKVDIKNRIDKFAKPYLKEN